MQGQQRTALRARWVLAVQEETPHILTDKWIIVEGSHIAGIVRDRPASVDRIIDRPDLLVLPGFINLHNHCFSELLIRGRTEDISSQTFENDLVYGLLMPLSQLALEVLSAEEIKAALALGMLQVIKG